MNLFLLLVEDTLTPKSRCGYEIIGEINGYGARYTPSAQGLLTGSLRGILGNAGINEHLWSSRYYDAKGRLVQEHAAQAPTNKWSRTYYAYDYSGNLIKRGTEHMSFSSMAAKETYTYNYDGWGRPTVTTHKLGTGSADTLFFRTYDRAGRLVSEARNDGATGLQTAYTYNVRSWLTDLSVGSEGSTFKQKLYYNEARDNATATAYQWGGNIARMDWKAGGEERTYQFGYDLLSRLTGATYSGPDAYQDNFTRTYGYDQNGNLTSRGATPYTYGGNHLSTGTYDANGNLTAGMGYTTTYNLLNLPSSAVNADQTTYYFYSSDGVKVEKDVFENYRFTTALYAGNLIYDDISPKMLLIEGGYIDLSGDTPAYRFYVTDHQGNIRAVTDGTGTVLRTNHYDPYGEEVLPVLAPSGTLPTSTAGTDAASRYMYGAKEWDADLSLYDFSARYYTPSGAASFTTMNPLCEKYYSVSPYAYCAGNPVNLVDPSGAIFTKGSKQHIDRYLDEVSIRFSDALGKSVEYEQQLMDENLSKNKRKRIERKLEKQNEIMREMATASLEYYVLKGSSQVYDVSIDKSITAKYSDDNTTVHGITVFDNASSTLQIKLSPFSLATIAHELKHAFQFECGKMSYSAINGLGSYALYDISDEEEAFARGLYFGGEPIRYRDYPTLPKDNRRIIKGKASSVLQGQANTYNVVFRFNGITYYGRTN